MRIHPLAELSVLLVDTATIADLHQRWLGEAGPTDVLAFPMDELRPPPPGSDRNDRAPDNDSAPNVIGDVVLCPEVATAQAAEAQRPVADELEMLCTHGILHLLGYDHAEPDERAAMFGLQDRLLGSWRAERAQYHDLDGAVAGAEAGGEPVPGAGKAAGRAGDTGEQASPAPGGDAGGALRGERDAPEQDESG
jgi:probable rRNA maturation factor